MLNIDFTKRIKKSEAGFTFVELLIASAMSIIVLGLLAHVFRSQQKEFGTQTGLNTMQANGRGAVEFITRSVQNAGFNVQRGTRFLSASDHFLTAVYDEDNDNVIQNDEVITYALANAWSGTATETHSFVAWFDVDGNGNIEPGENPTISVGMTITAPPFNLYKVTPNAAGTGIVRSLVARNIDNMVIKYYDKDAVLLPVMSDTNGDGVGNANYNVDGDAQPDGGSWTFRVPRAELNDIRKVEIELLGRSRKPNPRENTNSGTYPTGSLAAVASGSTTYSDKYFREDFTGRMAPRNLIMAPWGNVAMLASPTVVACPNNSSVTATLLDANGEAISGSTINFTSTGGTTTTVGSPTQTSDSNGAGTTTITYDFSSPNFTATVSGSALVDDGSGNMKPIYSATPVSFTFGTSGGFVDPFDGSQTQAWDDLNGGTLDFEIPTGEEYFVSLQASPTTRGALNGCTAWKDYSVQANLKQESGTTWGDSDYMGLILRHQDQNNYYWITLHKMSCGTCTDRYLRILKYVGGIPSLVDQKQLFTIPEGVGSTDTPAAFQDDVPYTLKAQILGDDIRVKLWKPVDPTDPNSSEPPAWETNWSINGTNPVLDTSLTQGDFGVLARDQVFQFDNVTVTNPEPII